MNFSEYQLTKSDRIFVERHRIPQSKLFNAEKLATAALKVAMKEAGAWIAVNARGCGKSGHTIRTNGGHCAECEPKRVGFAMRNTKPGLVYLAISKNKNLLKIGMTIDLDRRQAQLNGYAYGDCRDWTITHYIDSPEAGREEFEAQSLLSQFSTSGRYFKDGQWIVCYELFDCDLQQGLSCLQANTRWKWIHR